jgi:hypothetical protein
VSRLCRSVFIATALCLVVSNAKADDTTALTIAKEAFSRGLELTREQKWGEALDAFETAGRAKRHALTTYNAAVAERALSRYTRARVRFAAALEEDAASGGKELPENFREDTKTFLAELDALLVHLDVKLDRADASLAIDGRPLTWLGEDRKVAYAGVAQASAGERVERSTFELIVDPGVHVFTVTKEGFAPAVRRETAKTGVRGAVELSLTAMPGSIRVDASQKGAAVRVDEIDVGVAPVLIDRPAGPYRVDVRKAGFVPYKTKVNLQPGQRADLFAPMAAEQSLTSRWWFWTMVVGAVSAGAITGILIASRPDYDGGNQGWVAQPR